MNAHSVLQEVLRPREPIGEERGSEGVRRTYALPSRLHLPDLLAELDAALVPYLYWQTEERSFLALGSAVEARADGEDRFERLDAFLARMRAAFSDAGTSPAQDDPFVVAAFAFQDKRPSGPWQGWPALLAFVPKVLVVEDGLGPRVRLSARFGEDPFEVPCRRHAPPTALPPTDGSPSDFLALVADAVAAIRRGELQKVVLAREVRVPYSGGAPYVLRRLAAESGTLRFALGSEAGVFLGATPERLCRKAGDVVRVSCLAGSRRRGSDAVEDEVLANLLRESAKDQAEHRFVVEAVQHRLRAAGLVVEPPPPPRLLRTRHVQHLFTPVTARGSIAAAELLRLLHPTPAVGGVPREEALAFLAAREGMVRGYYAGGIGYLTAAGDAEFWVGLRAALVRDGIAHLYAGCGVVADSSPEAEYEETTWKLEPLLEALGASEGAR